MFSLIFILFLSLNFYSQSSEALSCLECGTTPCEVPACCESGFYAKDACGCCPICANPQGSACGGPFHTTGSCGVGLSCLRKCDCQTVANTECVFPFIYKGKRYTQCTKDNSDNGEPWCATQVNPSTGVVVDGKWGDCQEGCPGTGFECDQGFLFNLDGRCLNETQVDLFRNSGRNVPVFQLESGLDENLAVRAPFCGDDDKSGQGLNHLKCRCAPNVSERNPEINGGCARFETLDDLDDNLAHGWCFLENILDYQNPTQNCFDDVQWSPTAGRFWSNLACKPGSGAVNPNSIIDARSNDEEDDSIVFDN